MCVIDESAAFALNPLHLLDVILTQAPGTIARLDLGVNLLAANSGQGSALIELARLFPRSRFFGLEHTVSDLAVARTEARIRGLQNIRFESETGLMPYLTGGFHFALRLPRPRGVDLSDIARLLRDGGLVFDLREDAPDPQIYRDAALTFWRSLRLPDCFCALARR